MSMVEQSGCSCRTTNPFFKFLQDQQVLQFLMGLNDEFQIARGNVLLM